MSVVAAERIVLASLGLGHLRELLIGEVGQAHRLTLRAMVNVRKVVAR
jgi:hypothetical protein